MAVALATGAAAADVEEATCRAGKAEFRDALLGGVVGGLEPVGEAFIAACRRDRVVEEMSELVMPVGVVGDVGASASVAVRSPCTEQCS